MYTRDFPAANSTRRRNSALAALLAVVAILIAVSGLFYLQHYGFADPKQTKYYHG